MPRHAFLRLCLMAVFAISLCASAVLAQTTNGNGPGSAPDFTTQSLRAELDALPDPDAETGPGEAGEDALTDAQVEQIRAFLTTATEGLENAARQNTQTTQFSNDVQAGRERLSALRTELDTLQTVMGEREVPSPEATLVGEAAMFATEQELLARESELRALQAEIEGYRAQAQEIGARLTAAPRELSEARSRLGEVTSLLAELAAGELDPVGEAQRKALQAREYFRRRQIAALEAEIASLPLRQEILAARRNLAELRADVLTEDVLALQELTGQRKLVEARQRVQQTQAVIAGLTDPHPVVAELAEQNLRLAQMISEMAADEPRTSRRLAAVRGQTANVQNDLTAATELVSLGQLDREAGTTLRRLGNQLPAAPALRSDLREIQRSLASLTRQRVVAQENLRDLPVGAIDAAAVLERARDADPALPDFDPDQRRQVVALSQQRRAMLREIAATATSRINAVAELQTAQLDLVEETDELRSLLDENLLWVRSVPSIGLDWPRKVLLGAAELFSPEHLRTSADVFLRQALRLWPLTLAFGIGIILALRMRPMLWEEVVSRADKVGRVKQDSLWHTPAVIGAGLVYALPVPLLFLWLALLFSASDNPDLLVGGLSDGFAWLAIFTLLVISWQIWDRDRSLFGAHFKMPRSLREAVQTNLKWFLPVFGTTSFLLSLTVDMRGENVYEGFSLAIFLITAITLAVFSFRVVWQRRDQLPAAVADDGFIARYRSPICIIIVGLPIVAAIMAGAGWYESADDLLQRYFFTGWILLFTYVVFGALRRAITVAQRQIKYRQAVERREAQIKARKEAQEAEERGEELPVPPPVDTKEIDVSAMSRQSAQLLRAIVALGLIGLLYLTWSGLLPALSIFDGFEITTINTGETGEDGQPIERAITLWTVLQALAIGVIAVIAARNLPGFLEIFVLDRLGVDAGTRYAIVTVLGYIIIVAGIVFFFQRIGLRWSQLQWILTGLSVGIGFGLRTIIANFVSGLILLFERPIRIGDFVTIGDKSGTVTRIKIRATTLGDLDNREILIPNENLISQEVTNWTLSNSVTRVLVRVGIAYGSDTERAREVMLGVLRDNPKILDNPPMQVFFLGFGDSSLDFEVRFFLRNFEDRFPVNHQVHTEINKALAREGFEIPFPQRDLNWRGQDGTIEVKQGGARKPATQAKSKSTAKKSS